MANKGAKGGVKASHNDRYACCAVCTKLPFRQQEPMLPFLTEQELGYDFETGVCESVCRSTHNKEELGKPSLQLPSAAASKTAERCARHTRRLTNDLRRYGLLDEDEEHPSGWRNCKTRSIAPFTYAELRLGRLLGTGGFSSVFEVHDFSAEKKKSFNEDDQKARLLLRDSAIASIDYSMIGMGKGDEDKQGSGKEVSSSTRTSSTIVKEPQYAIKHLRRGLLKEPELFERAAIDMVLEAQLLLAMDHPNIIRLRGWSTDGVEGYRNGLNTDFFIIIDRLAESLDQRMFRWRNAFKKYKSRVKLPFGKQKYNSKLDDLLVDRLTVLYDITLALEYMHEHRIINRDLKSSNIGFDMKGELKLFDFGLSRLLPSRRCAMEDGYSMSRVGTKYCMAPEVRAKAPYNLSADIYSFGVCCWEIMSLSTPRETLQKLKKDDIATSRRCILPICGCWPYRMQSLIEQCLSNDPHTRPKTSDIRVRLEQESEKLDSTKDLASRGRSSTRFDMATVDTTVVSVTSHDASTTGHRSSVISSDFDVESTQSSFAR